MFKLFTIQWAELWRAIFVKQPAHKVTKNGWRCTYCKAERYYVRIGDNAVLEPVCEEMRRSQQGHVIACPLAPIDDDGVELTYEQWRAAK